MIKIAKEKASFGRKLPAPVHTPNLMCLKTCPCIRAALNTARRCTKSSQYPPSCATSVFRKKENEQATVRRVRSAKEVRGGLDSVKMVLYIPLAGLARGIMFCLRGMESPSNQRPRDLTQRSQVSFRRRKRFLQDALRSFFELFLFTSSLTVSASSNPLPLGESLI